MSQFMVLAVKLKQRHLCRGFCAYIHKNASTDRFNVVNPKYFITLKLRSSRSESNRRLRATCTRTAAHTWHADAIWKLLLFWPMVARRRRLESDLDERSLCHAVQVKSKPNSKSWKSSSIKVLFWWLCYDPLFWMHLEEFPR